MERDGMIFYASFYEAIKDLPPEEFKECVTALMEYGLHGETIEMSNVAKMFYTMAKPQVDANNKRFENGKKGGRKPKPNDNQTETKTEPKENQTETKVEPKDKVKVKEKVKDKEKDIISLFADDSNESPQYADVEAIPLTDGTEFRLTQKDYEEFCRLYPNVDIKQAIANMRGWSNANPSRKKTARGVKAFINNWLSKEQNSPRGYQRTTVRRQLVPDYMTQDMTVQDQSKPDDPSVEDIRNLMDRMRL